MSNPRNESDPHFHAQGYKYLNHIADNPYSLAKHTKTVMLEMDPKQMRRLTKFRRTFTNVDEFHRQFFLQFTPPQISQLLRFTRVQFMSRGEIFREQYDRELYTLIQLGGIIKIFSILTLRGSEITGIPRSNEDAAQAVLGLIKSIEAEDRAPSQYVATVKKELTECEYLNVCFEQIKKPDIGIFPRLGLQLVLRFYTRNVGKYSLYHKNKDFLEVMTHLLSVTKEEFFQELQTEELSWQIELLGQFDYEQAKLYAPRNLEMQRETITQVLQEQLTDLNHVTREHYLDIVKHKPFMHALLGNVRFLSDYYLDCAGSSAGSSVLAAFMSLPRDFIGKSLHNDRTDHPFTESTKKTFEAFIDNDLLSPLLELYSQFAFTKHLMDDMKRRAKLEKNYPSVPTKSEEQLHSLYLHTLTLTLSTERHLLAILMFLSHDRTCAQKIASHKLFKRLILYWVKFIEGRVSPKDDSIALYHNNLWGNPYSTDVIYDEFSTTLPPSTGYDEVKVSCHLPPFKYILAMFLKNLEKHTKKEREGKRIIAFDKCSQYARELKDLGNMMLRTFKPIFISVSVWIYTYSIRLTESTEDETVFLNNRSEAFLRLGEYDEAIKDLEIVLKREPNNEKAKRRLDRVHKNRGSQ